MHFKGWGRGNPVILNFLPPFSYVNFYKKPSEYNDYPTCSKRHGRLEHVG